jgi:hypothetical protein
MTTKICNKCKIEKDVCEFNKKTTTKKGVVYLKSRCKLCQSFYEKKRRQENEVYFKEWYDKNRETRNEYRRKYYDENKEKIKQQNKKHNINKKNKFRIEYNRNPIVKLKHRLSCRLREIIKFKTLNKNKEFNEIIGCTIEELKKHLEKQFLEGMNWENHGFYGWHIDHIIPLSSAITEEDLYKLCHYTNLQPLWAKDNLKKSNKIL